MKWFRDRKLEARIKVLEEQVSRLQGESVELRAACTMRVGMEPLSLAGFYYDRRPVLTAIQAVQKLMADAGIEPRPVPAVNAGVEFVQAEKAPK